MYTQKKLTNLDQFEKFDATNWEEAKYHIYTTYVSKGNIEDYGDDILYTPQMDLAVATSVQETHGLQTYVKMITEEDIIHWNVTADNVFERARENMEHDRRKRILSFSESIMQCVNPLFPIIRTPKSACIMVGSPNNESEGSNGVVVEKDEEKEIDNVLVVMSQKESFGASYAFMQSTLEELYRKFGNENFYMVPMSINKMMCVREGYATNDGKKENIHAEDELLDMVCAMNDYEKECSNILSYRIYYYCNDDGKSIMSIKSR